MKKPTVICFDIGNTLIKLDNGKGFCAYFSEQLGVELSDIRDLINTYFLCAHDTIDTAVKNVCQIMKCNFHQKILDNFETSNTELFDDVIPTLKALKVRGMRIIAFSNCTPWEADGLNEYGLTDYISRVYYSHDIGAVKPNIKAFQYVQNDVGVHPNEILHIGDTMDADIKGALDAGWNACLLNRTLKKLDGATYSNITIIDNLNCLIKMLDSAV